MGNQSAKEVQDKPVVVVVGAGYGGHTVAQLLDKDCAFNVVLIDRKDHHVHNMAGCRAVVEQGYEKEILIPYSNLLKYGSVVQGEVLEITPESIRLHGHDELVKFDYLIIATGSSYAFPGKLAEAKMEDAFAKYKASQDAVRKANHITIVGGGPVGVELAGEIMTDLPDKKVTLVHSREMLCAGDGLTADFSSRIRKSLEELKVEVVVGERTILEELKEDSLLRQKQLALEKEDYDEAKRLKKEMDDLKDSMEKVQINIRDDIPRNYAEGKRTLMTNKGRKIETDLVFFCMGVQVNNKSLKAFEAGMNRGRLKVDKHLRVEGYQNIFALGDIADLGPMMGYYATEQAKYLATYFEKGIRQKKNVKPYPAQGVASIVSIGRKGGVAQLPLTKKGVVFGSTTACMIKSKDMFTTANWNTLNIDRKTKTALKVVAKGDKHAVSLGAAMQISESQAEEIINGKLPELDEREGYFS